MIFATRNSKSCHKTNQRAEGEISSGNNCGQHSTNQGKRKVGEDDGSILLRAQKRGGKSKVGRTMTRATCSPT